MNGKKSIGKYFDVCHNRIYFHCYNFDPYGETDSQNHNNYVIRKIRMINFSVKRNNVKAMNDT